ncbi:MAG: prepilin-type N-terminal cleavage/methylation domain-containing protein [Lentisphaerae bacterium]|nr:prepilin-type N-terminal cleavage/methylation domain-containing protein [Lentisphaerota bacterium]
MKVLEVDTFRLETTGGRRLPAGPHAFTLIELLVVTLLMGIVITAIGACLGAGLRVWDAAQHFGTAESDGLVAMDVVCRELRNTVAMQKNPFLGEEAQVTMAGLVKEQETGRSGLGTIRYSLDSSRRVLVRESWFYQDEDERVRRESLAANVVDLRFLYHMPVEPGHGGVTNGIPTRVDITLAMQESGDAPVVELTRSVEIAAGVQP